jgi:hypothetical protein
LKIWLLNPGNSQNLETHSLQQDSLDENQIKFPPAQKNIKYYSLNFTKSFLRRLTVCLHFPKFRKKYDTIGHPTVCIASILLFGKRKHIPDSATIFDFFFIKMAGFFP